MMIDHILNTAISAACKVRDAIISYYPYYPYIKHPDVAIVLSRDVMQYLIISAGSDADYKHGMKYKGFQVYIVDDESKQSYAEVAVVLYHQGYADLQICKNIIYASDGLSLKMRCHMSEHRADTYKEIAVVEATDFVVSWILCEEDDLLSRIYYVWDTTEIDKFLEEFRLRRPSERELQT